ncbi:cyclohexanecarboxylate-CoA ligase [Streptomyces spiroverticillatus]|uniref:Cyclohexanecarboxylate-CoA ligase n=1 Tax=Streptomyces finlayi TaxID=67296 RepID=A0A918X4E9_9ACTN|nr:AMP-binding protein [Streptomyces finlayi]GHA31825.1 cyclohexanecarboxylate-CoA ligase [Streptomyces spiroverticillatus]GHD10876.1 cyclohexanecarboxylate-CoA ligase [Streptomyces finlayi]
MTAVHEHDPEALARPGYDAAPRDGWKAAGYWREETVLHDLRRWAARTPDRPALVCYAGDEAETVTYTDLARRVDRFAAGLLRLGVRRGDVVTLQLPNSWQLVALCLAAARVGAVPGPVVGTMRRREVEFMCRLTGSPVYIGAAEVRGFSYAAMSAEVAAAVPTLRHRVLLGGDAAQRGDALDLMSDLYAPEPDPQLRARLDALEAGPDDPAQVMFTSGTTGEPKGVVHSHNTLYSMNRAQADVLGLGGDEVTAMGSPTTHQAGFTWNFVMPLLLGATAVQVDRWDAERMLRILQEQRVSFFMGAPTFLSDLIDAQRRTPHDLSALRSFATGSAPIAPLLVEDADAVLGCRVYALWGMTENGCVTVTRPEHPVLRAAESDGTPVPGMEVRITGKDGRPVAAGETGTLQVRGSAQCLGYFARQEVYEAQLTGDGWFDTGDLARDDGHGGIRIVGRVKDMIVRGAENIPVVEVEGALLRHPAVKDVAVVGFPDPRLGERACAFLVTTGSPVGLPELREHLARLGMTKTYWPERVEQLPELPRTPSGKIQKFALRDLLRV